MTPFMITMTIAILFGMSSLVFFRFEDELRDKLGLRWDTMFDIKTGLTIITVVALIISLPVGLEQYSEYKEVYKIIHKQLRKKKNCDNVIVYKNEPYTVTFYDTEYVKLNNRTIYLSRFERRQIKRDMKRICGEEIIDEVEITLSEYKIQKEEPEEVIEEPTNQEIGDNYGW